MAQPTFTIAVLLYGDYLHLAARCLNSIVERPWFEEVDLRVATNELGQATSDYVDALVEQGSLLEKNLYVSSENSLKYPMMRRLLYDPDNPVATDYFMWFDDDSYISAQQGVQPTWLAHVASAMVDADMIGAPHRMALRGSQHLWIQHQPWYAGKPVKAGQNVSFFTGGWWTIRTEILQAHNWPVLDIKHRGGDVMLGELGRQQGLKMRRFTAGVAINADDRGRMNGSPHRGYNEPAVGVNFSPSVAAKVHEAAMPLPVPPPRVVPIVELDL